MGDPTEIRLLIGGGIGLNPEIAQYRSQHDIHLGDCEISAQTPACSATERQPRRCRRFDAIEALRIESFWVRENARILVKIGSAHEHGAPMRNPPLAEFEVRRINSPANHIDDGAYSQGL